MSDTKLCKQCGAEKPLSEFYRYGNGSPAGKCRACTCLAVRTNRANKIDYYRARDRERSLLPHRVAARDDYYQTHKGDPERKKRWSETKRAWSARNPNKRSAHILIGNAIRDGLMRRLPCEQCGDDASEAHHDDYRYPLNVRWLCKHCHGRHHATDRHTEEPHNAKETN